MTERRNIDEKGFDQELREWSGAEPATSEAELRRIVRTRLAAHRRTPRFRVALVAAAASAIAVLVGVQSVRRPPPPAVVASPEVVYETGDNLILVLREDGPPIYVVKDRCETGETP